MKLGSLEIISLKVKFEFSVEVFSNYTGGVHSGRRTGYGSKWRCFWRWTGGGCCCIWRSQVIPTWEVLLWK